MHPFLLIAAALGPLSGLTAHAQVAGAATVAVLRGSAKTDAGVALKERDQVAPGTTVVTASALSCASSSPTKPSSISAPRPR